MLPSALAFDPSLDALADLARDAFEALPADVRAACGRVVFRVAELADPWTLRQLGIAHPMGLSGLYRGSALFPELASHGSTHLPEVWLYRQPILAEWRERGNVGLDELVAHVLIHEIAHHFGWDDDQIDYAQGDD